MEGIKKTREGEELMEAVWEEWKRVLITAERGIGRKKVNGMSKGWWSEDVVEAIKDRRERRRNMRHSRRNGHRSHDDEVAKLWETYREKRKRMKKIIIRDEKRQNRKKVLQEIKHGAQ